MQQMRQKMDWTLLEIGAIPLVRGLKSHGNPLSSNRRFQQTCYSPKTGKPDFLNFHPCKRAAETHQNRLRGS